MENLHPDVRSEGLEDVMLGRRFCIPKFTSSVCHPRYILN